ncbi:MAG: F0F1 ATP synthase subunit gamma [Candidatus Peribacteria bacterium]|nr:F0F1 ATP synthase subunit gamma [Candidatus Peribacteria bacterium]
MNTNLFKRILQSYGTRKDKVDILAIGKKGKEFFERNGRNVIASLQIKDKIIAGELVELYNFLRNATNEKQYSRIKIYFNFFKNALVQRPTRFSLFPLNQENLDAFNEEIELKNPINRREYREMIIEPDEETYKENIIQEIIENMIYYSVLNAKMSEHAARMIAMKNSKDNCKELETNLNSTYNKSRQMKITQEISEIVGTKSAIER